MFDDWNEFPSYIIQAEGQGQVTRTFRRLDPARQQAVLQAILDEAAASAARCIEHQAGRPARRRLGRFALPVFRRPGVAC